MKRIKRILAVLIILILDLLKIVINLLVKAECWVAGVGSYSWQSLPFWH